METLYIATRYNIGNGYFTSKLYDMVMNMLNTNKYDKLVVMGVKGFNYRYINEIRNTYPYIKIYVWPSNIA